jgi:hypothetical protein
MRRIILVVNEVDVTDYANLGSAEDDNNEPWFWDLE